MIDTGKRDKIKDFLVALAKKKSVTGYVKLNEKLQLGVDFSDETAMNDLYNTLDEISAQSYQESQVFLGIVIVNKMRNRPSARFYKGIEAVLGSKIDDQDNFFETEREKLYAKYMSR